MIHSAEITGVTPAWLTGQRYQLAKSDPSITIPTLESMTRSLQREKFSGGQRLFVASELEGGEGTVFGQTVARLSPTLKCPAGKPLGMLGFFAATNHPEKVCELLKSACEWLRDQGAECIVGPIDGDTWHSYRLNIGPYDQPNFLMEPINPAWYPSIWAAAGFVPLEHYHSKLVDDVQSAADATRNSWQRATGNGYRFRSLDQANFDLELKTIYEISCLSFADNFLYDLITESEFMELYRPSKAIADPQLVLFAEDPLGTPVGFLFNVIDYAESVAAMKGGTGWLAKLRFWRNKQHAKAVNFKSIGVLPDHRRQSLAGAMMHLGYLATLGLGYSRANLCLIRDGNASSKLDGGLGKILRRYTLYQTGPSQFSQFTPLE